MLGAICGDVIGSRYEIDNIKTKDFELFTYYNCFTDDSVMTCAIGNACYSYKKNRDLKKFKKNCILQMQKLGLEHINAGYGGKFIEWLAESNPKPYYSYGNGSAMRVSPVAYVSETLEEAEKLAEITASVSHNHPDGINGAKSIAGAIWLLRHGKTKEEVKEYIEKNYYKLNFSLEEIRDNYWFDVSCQGSVPQAIVSFLESNSFEDAIRNAISIGGDSDTIAAISGSLAESYYGIPQNIVENVVKYLDDSLLDTLENFYGLNFHHKSVLNQERRK